MIMKHDCMWHFNHLLWSMTARVASIIYYEACLHVSLQLFPCLQEVQRAWASPPALPACSPPPPDRWQFYRTCPQQCSRPPSAATAPLWERGRKWPPATVECSCPYHADWCVRLCNTVMQWPWRRSIGYITDLHALCFFTHHMIMDPGPHFRLLTPSLCFFTHYMIMDPGPHFRLLTPSLCFFTHHMIMDPGPHFRLLTPSLPQPVKVPG